MVPGITISLRSNAVEASRIISPSGIAEIDGAVGERTGKQRSPRRVRQICACLDDNRDIGGADDVKAKTIRLQPKAAIRSLNHWIPQQSRETDKIGIPAHGSREVINFHHSGIRTLEQLLDTRENWGIALEISCLQVVVVEERTSSNVGDATGDRHAGQATAICKRTNPDVGDAVAEHDTAQVSAGTERIIS